LTGPPLVFSKEQHLAEDDSGVDNECQYNASLTQPEDQFGSRRKVFDGSSFLDLIGGFSCERQRTSSRPTQSYLDCVAVVRGIDDAIDNEGDHEQS
jgi:hypothetical protein